MESTLKEQTTQRSIQDYLSLGYLYLLALGIIREVIYFSFLEINILSYSNILDVLLSPLVYIAKSPIVIITIIIFALGAYFFNNYMARKKQKSTTDLADQDEKILTKSDILKGSFVLFALVVFSFFMGTGIGSGNKHSKKLEKGEFKISHEITFIDKEKIQAKVLASNSQYIFYVLENGKNVTISPISGNIKMIVKLPSKND